MGFVVLIPARLASTRLPGKPLADIGGAPMVVRVAQRAAAAGAERVVVAADDARIVYHDSPDELRRYYASGEEPPTQSRTTRTK